MIVSPQYEQTLVALSRSALWLRRILFFDFDVFRFGCAMDYLLTFLCGPESRNLKFISTIGLNYFRAFLTGPKTD
jgi:hypothetical protein